MPSAFVFTVLVAVFMALCALTDYRTKRIPNWLTLPAAIAGLVFSALAPGGIGLVASLAGFAVGMALLLLPWLLGGGGMGDVKMLAALGTWLGPIGILVAFGLGSILAAFGMIAVLTASTMAHGFSSTRRRYVAAAAGGGQAAAPTKARRVLPFAVPMALSTWLVLAWMLLKVVH
jgi:prepilin peptidase CpaA